MPWRERLLRRLIRWYLGYWFHRKQLIPIIWDEHRKRFYEENATTTYSYLVDQLDMAMAKEIQQDRQTSKMICSECSTVYAWPGHCPNRH